MTTDEELDLLRREVADLRDRVARLESGNEASISLSRLGLGPTGKVFPQPMAAPQLPVLYPPMVVAPSFPPAPAPTLPQTICISPRTACAGTFGGAP